MCAQSRPRIVESKMWLSQVELLSRVATEKSQLATELLPARADAAVSPSPKSKGAWEGAHPARVRTNALSANAGAGDAHRESRDRLRNAAPPGRLQHARFTRPHAHARGAKWAAPPRHRSFSRDTTSSRVGRARAAAAPLCHGCLARSQPAACARRALGRTRSPRARPRPPRRASPSSGGTRRRSLDGTRPPRRERSCRMAAVGQGD